MTTTRSAMKSLRQANPVPVATGNQRAYRPARPRLALVAVGALACAALVLGLLGPFGQGSATPSAAAALDQAARAADIAASDPAARPDEYLQIRTDSTSMSSAQSDRGVSAWLERNTRWDYVSVSGSRPSWIDTGDSRVSEVLSGDEHAVGDRTPGEAWTTDLAPNDLPGSWQTPNPAWLASLPRDEKALRERLYADTSGSGLSPDGEVLVYVADVLRSGLVPADLRAALYRVLETIPGVDLVRRHDDGLISIGRLEPVAGARQELMIDPTTGEFVGERTTQMTAIPEAGVQAGTVTRETTVTTTVVPEVPPQLQLRAKKWHCTPDGSCQG